MSDLRERQRASTRDQLIEAVHLLLREEHPASISMPRVAERAGTSLRTVYRYFPTKEALLDAASESFRVPATAVGGAVNVGNLAEYLTKAWTGFSASIGAIRAQHLAPAGRAMRDLRLPRNRDGVRQGLRGSAVDLDDADVERLVDLTVTLISSSTYLELVDRLGHTPEDAARLAAWAVEAVVDRATREGAVAP